MGHNFLRTRILSRSPWEKFAQCQPGKFSLSTRLPKSSVALIRAHDLRTSTDPGLASVHAALISRSVHRPARVNDDVPGASRRALRNPAHRNERTQMASETLHEEVAGNVCDWCQTICDPAVQELNALTCSFAECPETSMSYHQTCLEKYLKSIKLDK